MKKVIRLNEKDIERLVTKIIKEDKFDRYAPKVVAAAIVILAVWPEHVEVTTSDGETRNGIVGEQITGEVINVEPKGTGTYGSMLTVYIQRDNGDMVKFIYIEDVHDKENRYPTIKIGDNITLKVKESDTFYYHGWGGTDADVTFQESLENLVTKVINESLSVSTGSAWVSIDDDELEFLDDDPQIQDYINQERLQIEFPQLYYVLGDTEVLEYLDSIGIEINKDRWYDEEDEDMMDEESLNEAYDDPTMMARHLGGIMGRLSSGVMHISQAINIVTQGIRQGEDKENIREALSHIQTLIDDIMVDTKKIYNEIYLPKLKLETKNFYNVLDKFRKRIDILINMSGEYSKEEFKNYLFKFMTKVNSSMLKYVKTLNDVNKKMYLKFQGKDRGEYGI
jgi:hypothetical protein